MGNSGYSKLYRDFLDSDLWLAEPFTKGQAWVDLFSLANHKDRTIWIRGVEVVVRRGELARSELSLARRWQWSRGKVRRFLDWLEGDKKIEHQKSNVTSLIYIINYDRYNSNDTADSTADGHQTVQQTDTKRYTDKHDKHYKHEKNIPPYPQDWSWYLKNKADVLGLGEFKDSLCRFLVNRAEPIKQKGGVDYILNQALEIKNAGYDVNYFIDEAIQNGSKWLNVKTNGKKTEQAEAAVVYRQKTSAELDAEIERLMQ